MRRADATLRLTMIAVTGIVTAAMLPAPTHAAAVAFEASCSDRPRVDSTPPSIPGNARYTVATSTTLRWDPSTDDTGVVQYQIFHRTQQIAATTATSITIPTPPPMVTTYGVRAVDAAGNVSPFATIHFGQLPDSTPPTVPANLRVTQVCLDSLEVRWDQSTDGTFVVGYEIFINNTLITKVGDTRVLLPYPPYPLFPRRLFLTTRAWDPSYNYSPFYQPGLVIWPRN